MNRTDQIQQLETELGTWLAAYRSFSAEYTRTQKALKTAYTWHQGKNLRPLSTIGGDCEYARAEVMRVSAALSALMAVEQYEPCTCGHKSPAVAYQHHRDVAGGPPSAVLRSPAGGEAGGEP